VPKDAPEQADTFRILASWYAPHHLIDIDVEAKVVVEDLAGKARHGDG
jgi:hypothetical protein